MFERQVRGTEPVRVEVDFPELPENITRESLDKWYDALKKTLLTKLESLATEINSLKR